MASTGLLVATIRAMESTRDDRLFDDPFADTLAGETGRQLLAEALAATGERSTVQIVVRTRFFDEALLRATRAAKQVVILASGMAPLLRSMAEQGHRGSSAPINHGSCPNAIRRPEGTGGFSRRGNRDLRRMAAILSLPTGSFPFRVGLARRAASGDAPQRRI